VKYQRETPELRDRRKTVRELGIVAATALISIGFSIRTQASAPPVCADVGLLGYAPSAEAVKAHREFEVPYITYPYGTKLTDMWGMNLELKIDTAGRVVCYSAMEEWGFDEVQPLNDQRRALLSEVGKWRYRPFELSGRPVPTVVTERINEREAPIRHVATPDEPLSDVRISLERTRCYGTCPAYKVELQGDGRVTYTGKGFVDIEGKHSYQVPVERVKSLLDSFRAKDIWSLRDSYRTMVTDLPTCVLTVSLGEQTRRIEDYMGTRAGMPSTVTEFENQVDDVSQSIGWIDLSPQALDVLKSEGFPFRSSPGGSLLARAVSNEDSSDEAILALLQLGAPTNVDTRRGVLGVYSAGPILEVALKNRRVALIDPLIAKGLLDTGNHPDQAKIDAAFRSAIEGGSLAAVRRIWEVSGRTAHPAVSFKDISEDNARVHRMSPVTLLLSNPDYGSNIRGHWDGLEITRFLAAQGCDIKARAVDGRTLLHIAAEGGDVTFVEYLLAQGIPVSTPGKYGLPALGSAKKEDVAMVLLKAGTDMSKMDDVGEFRKYALSNHWQRVVAWLDTHN
jgi:Domain of unknown function (DUF6438)/Ankyrin repeats (3 copies)